MTARTSIGETPLKLAFGTEAMILMEVRMLSLRWTCYDEHNIDKGLKLALDCLPKVSEDAAQMMALYHERMTRHHNQRVKLKRFNLGDMVLWKVSQATNDPTQGKLSPNWKGPYKVVRYSRRGSYYLENMDKKSLPHP